MLTTFNGYYIWGLYMLAKVGFVLNAIFYDGEFVNLPRSFALVSYGFLGFAVTLPVFLFRKYFKPAALVLIVLLGLFVPMIGSDYAIIGTIGNHKFAFIYIAFLLLIYRNIMPENSKKVYLVDIGLLICAYTNITVYPLLVFALIRYIPKLKGKDFYKKLLKDRTFKSLIGLGLLLLPQLIIVKIYGVPQIKGYLDTPYNPARTIEIFISRSYFYGLLFPINKHLTDVIVVLLALVTVVTGTLFSGKYRKIFWFGVATIFLATFLFVIKRTGISDSYLGYRAGGPDQFFYPQNWIFGFIFCLVLVEVISKIKLFYIRAAIYAALIFISLFVLAKSAGSYGSSNFMAEDVGTIYAISKQRCSTNQAEFDIPVYPSPNLLYFEDAPRALVCTPDAVNYYPRDISFGLKPFENNYLAGLGEKNNFTQTFKSPQDKLDGLNIYFSTFMQKVDTPYNLVIMKDDCKTVVTSTAIRTTKLKDNSYSLIKFPVQDNSKDVTYCFTIIPDGDGPNDPLAVQLSDETTYPEGITTINDQVSSKDVVFSLHYR